MLNREDWQRFKNINRRANQWRLRVLDFSDYDAFCMLWKLVYFGGRQVPDTLVSSPLAQINDFQHTETAFVFPQHTQQWVSIPGRLKAKKTFKKSPQPWQTDLPCL